MPSSSLQYWRVLQVPDCLSVFPLQHNYRYRLGHVLSFHRLRRHIPLCPQREYLPRPRLAQCLLLLWFLSDSLPTKVVELYTIR